MLRTFFELMIDEQQQKIKYGTFLQLKEIHDDLDLKMKLFEKFEVGVLDVFDNTNVSMSADAFKTSTQNQKENLTRLTLLVQEKKKLLESRSTEVDSKYRDLTVNFLKKYDSMRDVHEVFGRFSSVQTEVQEKVALIIDFYYGLADILNDQSKLQKRKTFGWSLKEQSLMVANCFEKLDNLIAEIRKEAGGG